MRSCSSALCTAASAAMARAEALDWETYAPPNNTQLFEHSLFALDSEQTFDWPMGLLIQSSKPHCEATGGCNPGFRTLKKRPRRVVPSLLALFLQPPRLQIERREPWI